MEWSPFQNQGSSKWIPQWMCVSCHRIVGLETRDDHRIFYSHCQVICPTLVVDCSSNTQWMWCPRCQRREKITSQDAPRSVVQICFFLWPTVHDGPSVWMGSVSHLSPKATVLSHGFSAHSFHSSWFPPCIPQDLGLPSRMVISGIHRRLRSFICTVIISSFWPLILRLHVLCSLGGAVVSIC